MLWKSSTIHNSTKTLSGVTDKTGRVAGKVCKLEFYMLPLTTSSNLSLHKCNIKNSNRKINFSLQTFKCLSVFSRP